MSCLFIYFYLYISFNLLCDNWYGFDTWKMFNYDHVFTYCIWANGNKIKFIEKFNEK